MKLRMILTFLCSFALLASAASGQTIFKKPEQAAQTLYSTWQKKNKTKARNAATRSAIEKLFGARRQKMNFKGCAKREEGDYECIFENRKNDLTLAMLLDATRRGYRIKSLSFSSEAL